MSLLFEDKLSAAINSLLMNETCLRIAVAFIGDGASQWINPAAEDVKIVCNLAMNGTNPTEVQKLIQRFGQENVKQIEKLHTKLYIGSEYAIVGSANLSANGLGNQPTALREAGYKFKLDRPSGKRSLDWFDDVLWADAREITDQDLQDAAERWKCRDLVRNGGPKNNPQDICDYDFDRDDFPLITWYEEAGWSLSDKTVKGKTEEQREELEEEVGNSVDIECKLDQDLLEKARDVFVFRCLKTSRIASRRASGCYTLRSKGIIIREAYHLDEEPREDIDVMLCDEVDDLFGFDQKSNYEKFRDLINSDKYRRLREYDNDDEQCWFHPRIELMREFWKELQSQLCPK